MAGSTTQQFQMGIPSGSPSQGDSVEQIREVSDEMELYNPWDTPFLEWLGKAISGSAGQNYKHEFLEPDLWSKTLTVSATTAATTAETTITLSGNTAHQAPIGGVYRNTTSDELILVTARASDSTLTVLRDYAGSSGATMAASATLKFMGVARFEGSDTVYQGHPNKSAQYNYYQQHEQGFEISTQARASDVYGLDRYEYERVTLMETLKFGLEMSVLEGERFAGSSTTEPGLMGGIYYFATSANGAYVASLASAALTEPHLNAALRDRVQTVKRSRLATDVFVDPYLKMKIDSIYEGRRRDTVGGRTGGGVIDTIVNSVATLRVHMIENMRSGQLIALSKDQIKLLHWPGHNWREGRLPSNGLTSEKHGMVGVFTMEDRAIPGQWKLTSISTSS